MWLCILPGWPLGRLSQGSIIGQRAELLLGTWCMLDTPRGCTWLRLDSAHSSVHWV